MKNTSKSEKTIKDGDMLPEYRFDYRKARPNRFAKKIPEGGSIVVLDPDIAKVFTTTESVNKILRAIIHTMPEKGKKDRNAGSGQAP